FFTLHPGKKLLFMGNEFAQFDEWKDEEELDWFLDDFDMHRKARVFTKEALHLYKKSRILYENDHRQQGFEWIDVNNAEQSIVSFIRYGKQPSEALIIVCNFTPSVYHEYRVGVPFQTEYIEVLNSDDAKYGGSHQINPKRLQAKEGVLHGKPYSISMTVPPLGAAVFRAVKKRGAKKG
ncbi:alpha amylase C-terminal domain-containing protein, partial [Bacillus haynesii]|uniref:alpha amylase C-terminal domain-containing protein n=1 Tax=Bacillus haynesii TaxID=1925021 RepID=UPI002282F2F7